jgi:hypothetical protein
MAICNYTPTEAEAMKPVYTCYDAVNKNITTPYLQSLHKATFDVGDATETFCYAGEFLLGYIFILIFVNFILTGRIFHNANKIAKRFVYTTLCLSVIIILGLTVQSGLNGAASSRQAFEAISHQGFENCVTLESRIWTQLPPSAHEGSNCK